MIGALNGIAELWWGWMGPMLWQVSLLIIVIGAIDRLIRSWAWPEVRHALWLLVLIKLLIPPGWSFPGAIFPVANLIFIFLRKIIPISPVPQIGGLVHLQGRQLCCANVFQAWRNNSVKVFCAAMVHLFLLFLVN